MRFRKSIFTLGLTSTFFYFSPELEKRYALQFERIPPLQSLMSFRRFCDTVGLLARSGIDLEFWNKLWKYGAEYEKLRPFIAWNENWYEYTHNAHQRSANRILQFCIRNGGLCVKVGQSMSSAPALPDAYRETLRVLFDHNPHMSFDIIKNVIERDLQAPLNTIFSKFEETPIGAASLAQVHRATLIENGRKVAVKVEYPYITVFQKIDMYNMTWAMNVVYRILNWMNSPMKYGFDTSSPSYKDLCNYFILETDLLHEAKNACKVKENFKNWTSVHIPEIFSNYCSKRVLTMEYIDNACIATDIETMKKWGLSPKECTQIILDAFAKQLFEDGFLHADPHRSNVFVREYPGKKGRPQVVILDHGLYISLDPVFKERFARYYEALALNDTNYLKTFLRLYGINDRYYRIFSTMILLDIYDDRKSGKVFDDTGDELQKKFNQAMSSNFSKEQRQRIREVQKDLGKALSESLPTSFRLLLRNTFLLRSINAMNGSPCNRLITNARWASKCVHRISEEENVVFAKRWYFHFKSLLRNIYFEYKLLTIRLTAFMMALLMRYTPNAIKMFFFKRQLHNVIQSTDTQVEAKTKLEEQV